MNISNTMNEQDLRDAVSDCFSNIKLLLRKENGTISYNIVKYSLPEYTDEDIIESTDDKLVFSKKTIKGQTTICKFEVYLKKQINNFRKSEDKIFIIQSDGLAPIIDLRKDKYLHDLY